MKNVLVFLILVTAPSYASYQPFNTTHSITKNISASQSGLQSKDAFIVSTLSTLSFFVSVVATVMAYHIPSWRMNSLSISSSALAAIFAGVAYSCIQKALSSIDSSNHQCMQLTSETVQYSLINVPASIIFIAISILLLSRKMPFLPWTVVGFLASMASTATVACAYKAYFCF